MGTGIGFPELVLLLLLLGIFVFMIRMLVHAIKNPQFTRGKKILWLLAIIIAYPIGAILYLVLEFRKTKDSA
jgi:predicted membrane channel-forming protein YqfA (hemolysin III family)